MQAWGPSRMGVGQGAGPGARGEGSGEGVADGVLGTRCAFPACVHRGGGARRVSLGSAPSAPRRPCWLLAGSGSRRGAAAARHQTLSRPSCCTASGRTRRTHLEQRAVGPAGDAMLAAQPFQDGEACRGAPAGPGGVSAASRGGAVTGSACGRHGLVPLTTGCSLVARGREPGCRLTYSQLHAGALGGLQKGGRRPRRQGGGEAGKGGGSVGGVWPPAEAGGREEARSSLTRWKADCRSSRVISDTRTPARRGGGQGGWSWAGMAGKRLAGATRCSRAAGRPPKPLSHHQGPAYPLWCASCSCTLVEPPSSGPALGGGPAGWLKVVEGQEAS